MNIRKFADEAEELERGYPDTEVYVEIGDKRILVESIGEGIALPDGRDIIVITIDEYQSADS